MITRRLDDETGIIYVTAEGTWTIADVDAHYAALRVMIEPIRQAGDRVRLLSDVRTAVRQSPEVEAHTLEQMAATFQPGDRVVVLTGNDADKMHARELLQGVQIAAFTSLLPSEMWLLADDIPKIG